MAYLRRCARECARGRAEDGGNESSRGAEADGESGHADERVRGGARRKDEKCCAFANFVVSASPARQAKGRWHRERLLLSAAAAGRSQGNEAAQNARRYGIWQYRWCGDRARRRMGAAACGSSVAQRELLHEPWWVGDVLRIRGMNLR